MCHIWGVFFPLKTRTCYKCKLIAPLKEKAKLTTTWVIREDGEFLNQVQEIVILGWQHQEDSQKKLTERAGIMEQFPQTFTGSPSRMTGPLSAHLVTPLVTMVTLSNHKVTRNLPRDLTT